MASHHQKPQLTILLLTYTTLILLSTPTHSLTCTSQKFSNNLFTNCTDLPTLTASLHWTYSPKTSSLSIAFVAPPAKPAGWIAWGINPVQTGMAGSQALLAFKDTNGTMTVKTYNISSYSSLVEGKIAFEVTDARAEYSAGSIKMFATVKLPETMTEVNHVWQVGGAVEGGRPAKHEFLPENLSSKGKLLLQVTEKTPAAGGGAGSPISAPSLSPSPSPNPNASSGCRKSVMNVFFMVIIGALISY